MDAFIDLTGHDGIVRWFADYEKVDPTIPAPPNPSTKVSKTYNILLEYGAMDLGVYFQETRPPVLSDEIGAFWKSLAAVAFTMKGIHQLKVNDGLQTREYFG